MGKYSVLIILFVIAAAAAAYFFWGMSRPQTYRKATVNLKDAIFKVDVAETMAARTQGLSGRPGLSEGEGMLFIFPDYGMQGFWMKDMLFPIDIIWIKDDAVTGVAHSVSPQAEKSIFNLDVFYPPEPINRVLEVRAGTAERLGLKAGDRVIVEME